MSADLQDEIDALMSECYEFHGGKEKCHSLHCKVIRTLQSDLSAANDAIETMYKPEIQLLQAELDALRAKRIDSKKAVDLILRDLDDRSGFSLSDVDDETVMEMMETWQKIIDSCGPVSQSRGE